MRPFTIVEVFRVSIGVIGRNFLVLLGVSGALVFANVLLPLAVRTSVENGTLSLLAQSVSFMVTEALLISTASCVVARDASGHNGTLIGVLRGGVEAFVPVFVLTLLLNGMFLPQFLFDLGDSPVLTIGPVAVYLLFYVVFWTAFPALALERKGFASAFRLGMRHSRGKRLRIALIIVIIFGARSATSMGLVQPLLSSSMPENVQLFWQTLHGGPFDLIFVVAMAVSYFLLSESGRNDEQVLAVFD